MAVLKVMDYLSMAAHFPAGILIAFALVLAVTVGVYLSFFYVDFAHIKGLPEIPGGSLLSGHLYMLGDDHASTAEAWSKKYQWPVFQLRMGHRRTIMINSFEAARDWMVKNQTSTVDRPWFYTFHGVLSSTSAATIGTSPWNERTKKQRRIVGSLTTAPAIQRLAPMLDLETSHMIFDIYTDSEQGAIEIEPHIYGKRLALNIVMLFCYSTRFEKITDPMLLQILRDANTIAGFRSTNANFQDFIPHLRYFSKNSRTAIAIEVRNRRDKWLRTLLETVRATIGSEKEKKCVAKGLLTDDENRLTKQDVATILGGLMSGGFETLLSTAIAGIGFLASPEGQTIQKRAYDEIISLYPNVEEAFSNGVSAEKSPYIAAFVRETLRFYPPLKLLSPRQTYNEFVYNGATIPKGVLVYVNAQAANHDKATFGPDADVFRPERWLEKEDVEIPPPYHFSFGAGGRMCTASNFSNRILYAIFFRMILSFQMTASKSSPPETHYVRYNRDTPGSTAIPSDYKVRFTPRNKDLLEKCVSEGIASGADISM